MPPTPEEHRKFAKSCFNQTWELLDRPERTPAEDIEMIHLAHASRYHWGQVGTPLNLARGDWQISRVYAVLGFGVMGFKYAKLCLNLCEKHDLGDFDLAFAYEALARSSAVSGDIANARGYLEMAEMTGQSIAKEDDRQYLLNELQSITIP
ncbi:MAG: hypothetical protein H8E28_11050 [Anaerolineae bacterium]|nr:hypothetical protein [Anaerolineae bacterium]MBL6965537.1 hypothetical protein [Anaerolineales bacterium]